LKIQSKRLVLSLVAVAAFPAVVWLCLLGGARVYGHTELTPGMLFLYHRSVAEYFPLFTSSLTAPEVIENAGCKPLQWLGNLTYLVSTAGLLLALIIVQIAMGMVSLLLALLAWNGSMIFGGLYMTLVFPVMTLFFGIGMLVLLTFGLFGSTSSQF
jgi:hypothetical protein